MSAGAGSTRTVPSSRVGCRVRRRMRGLACTALVALLPLSAGCIVVHDRSGVPLSDAQVAAIVPGTTTRAQALELLGPPTGLYSTNLRSIVTGAGSPIEVPDVPPRVDEDVLTWQAVDVDASVAFFPVLFAWVGGRVSDRTLTLFFDGHGVVRYAAWRSGEP